MYIRGGIPVYVVQSHEDGINNVVIVLLLIYTLPILYLLLDAVLTRAKGVTNKRHVHNTSHSYIVYLW